MSAMRPGISLDIWEDDEVKAVLYLGAEKGRLRVVTDRGREARIPESRVANVGGPLGVAHADPTVTGKALVAHEAELRSRAGAVDAQALWEVLTDEGGQYSLDDLAELALGTRDGPARSAVLRRLVGDKLYFQRKQLSFQPRSREELGESVRRREREEERARDRREFLAAARARSQAQGGTAPAWPSGAERFLEALRDLAVRGVESQRIKEAEALLEELGAGRKGDSPLAAFELLVRLQVLGVDENLLVARHGIRREFTPEALAEAARTAAAPPLEPGRRDMTHLECYAIDDAETTEVDDAISLEELAPDLFRLGVHIADPTTMLPLGGIVDLEARDRATTFYLPEERMLMIPPDISEGVASLLPDGERPVLSFLVELDSAAQVRSFELVESRIRIRARLTYEQADAAIARGGGAPRLDQPPGDVAEAVGTEAAGAEGAALEAAAEAVGAGAPSLPEGLAPGVPALLAQAARLARALAERRVEQGALLLKGPDLDIKVRDGVVRLRRFEPWTPAWVLVSETMILANRLAAAWLTERGIPAIYRRQAPPDHKVEVPRGYDPVALNVARRQLKRTELSLTPGPHAGLGLPAYVQVTSPLRRYQDLTCQRQIRAALHGEPPPFDAEALWRVAASTDEAEKAAREVERGSRDYWLLRHLESLPHDRELEAVIVRAEERRTLIELVELVHITVLVPRPGYKPGRRLRVVVDAVNPRAGRLVVREVGGG